jgi:hypothetical protein
MSTATEIEGLPRELHELTRRFGRFLNAVDGHKRPLNRRESFHLQSFLGFLREGRWEEADAALNRAEQVAPIPARFADLPSTNDVAETAYLRAQLAHIIGGT